MRALELSNAGIENPNLDFRTEKGRHSSMPKVDIITADEEALGKHAVQVASSQTPLSIKVLHQAYDRQKDSILFGKFPAEIRNKIYESLLIANGSINPDHWDSKQDYNSQGLGQDFDTTITRCCVATLLEASPILYGRNEFVFGLPEEIAEFKCPGKPSPRKIP